MRRLLLALVVLFAASCRRSAPAGKEEPSVPTRAVAAGVPLVDYYSAAGDFSCRAPGDWRVLESKSIGPRVMFFGPGSEKYPNSVAISILRYPDGGEIRTPQAYWDALRLSGQSPSPLETRQVGGRTAYELHYDLAQRPLHGYKTLYMKREDVVLLPVKDGFFALSHSAPVEIGEQTRAVFEAVVASFSPKD